MSAIRPRPRSLDSIRKEAKRWLDALRAGAPGARERFARAWPDGPAAPTLRDVQHALAREHGFAAWAALKQAVDRKVAADRDAGAKALAQYEAMVDALLDAYRTGTPEAMERHHRFTWHRRQWSAMRTYVQFDLGKRPAHPNDDVDITRDDARHLIAVEHGFEDWSALAAFTESPSAARRIAAKPVAVADAGASEPSQAIVSSRDWDAVIAALAMHPSAHLHARGQMTDAVLADVSRVEAIAGLHLAGSQQLTDDGLVHLARLRALKHLDLSGTAITNRGLLALRDLPALETISLAGTHITDEGVEALAHWPELKAVNLLWTRTGDGALRALAGKRHLHELATGNDVTDAGLALLHELPRFKTWQGGEAALGLVGHRSLPNQLTLRGLFGDRGMQSMQGLDGLYALNLDDSRLAITAAALEPLIAVPRLGALSVDAKDDWMPYLAQMPRLRHLGAQDTVAGDEGFVALSASQSIEYIWGRRCHNLRRRGFEALARMPSLRGLSVSCLNVDDAGVSALPSFPSLRELMPMDVPDAGYRHIARCERLESLILMYCRETTDAATGRIVELRNLSYYFNSYTAITDRTPELLSTMDSLERITFSACHRLTDAGVARLARLPRLRELRVSGRGVTAEVGAPFPRGVAVFYEP